MVIVPVSTFPCDSYRPGHTVHWIQARLASELEPVPYRIANPRGEYFDMIDLDGAVQTVWFHDPVTVARACVAGIADYAKGCLVVPTGSAIPLRLYPAREEQRTPCKPRAQKP